MDIKKKIGDRIRIIRLENKFSQDELAIRANIERSFITHIESGRRNISVNTLEKVLSGLEYSFADFFNHKIFQKK